MAKSSRASSNKRNSQALRAKVFDPAAIARAERLSAKLQDLITQPKAKDPEVMEVGQVEDVEKSESKPEDALVIEDMEVDDGSTSTKTSASKAGKRSVRIQKNKRRGKSHSTIVFPKFDKKRRSSRVQKSKK